MDSKFSTREELMETLWEESFKDQISQDAYNSVPVEALVRFTSHFLRSRHDGKVKSKNLRFLEIGCGGGANLVWLAEKGIEANGIDISKTALTLCKDLFKLKKLEGYLGELKHSSATSLPFEDNAFDGVLESCVFQHLNEKDRVEAHKEAVRVLKPGGVFIGHMLSRNHSTYQLNISKADEIEPGTLLLEYKNHKGKINLESIGLAHFFDKKEYEFLLSGCSVIDPCETTYELPKEEAIRRGYDSYCQAMWVVYALK
jgi:ubiquinone/menaquinone biosynthesis C-methylase UbiE